MLIEVWSDVVCPWCYIGKRRLETAVSLAGVEAEIVHRAFQLDPSARTDGQRTIDMLAAKYGVTVEQAAGMMADVSQEAAKEGLRYNLLDGTSGNTRDAHRLLLWAATQGKGQQLLEALFHRYFELAEPVFTADDLAPVAESVGLDSALARELLAGTGFEPEVEADIEQARAFGAGGVPFFVLDRKVGVSGAQPLEVFTRAIAQASAAE